jgi:hypothetical protein
VKKPSSRPSLRLASLAAGFAVTLLASLPARSATEEVETRALIAAASLEDAIVVDCQLPGRLVQLGGMRSYMTPGKLARIAAVDCRARGGEYNLGNLASGTFSLKRWLPVAEKGDPEAQYYVARIYANGMDDVPMNHGEAARWYRKAADQGYKSAKAELGYLYEQGLGVPKDPLLALNLQREASGLGEDLDYASKIVAAQEQAAREVAVMSERLEAANRDIEELRADLLDTEDAARRQRVALAAREDALVDLRAQLAAARAAPPPAATADTPRPVPAADPARIKALETAVAAREGELKAAQAEVARLEAAAAAREAALNGQLTRSQTESLQMNQLLAATQSENAALRGQLAQAQQRYQRSQSELGALRAQFRADVERLETQNRDLSAAVAKNSSGSAALLDAKQREIERQGLRLAGLESELAAARKAQAEARVATSGASASSAALAARVAEAQRLHDAQAAQVRALNDEMATLRRQSAAQLAAAQQQYQAQLAARARELEARRQRIEALELETGQLREQVTALTARRSSDSAELAKEKERLQGVVALSNSKQSEMRSQMEQMQTEAAAERARLIADRERLAGQVRSGEATRQAQVAAMQSEIKAREAVIAAKEQQIVALRQQLTDSGQRLASLTPAGGADLVMRSPSAGTPPLLALVRSSAREMPQRRNHALVIANSTYCCMGNLATPSNDAREVAATLESKYGFVVQVLTDATSKQMMLALHDYAVKLTPNDNLLIYYAGHGGTRDGPPDRAFWLGVDADPDTEVTGWISAENVRAKIKQMNVAQLLLVTDSCFAGSILKGTNTAIVRRVTDESRLKMVWNRKARMVLTSGTDTPVVDSAGDRNHSLFAKYFLQILRQNDTVLSGEQLAYEITARIRKEAASLGVKQAPSYATLMDANHDFGEFFFVPKPQVTAGALASL